MNLSPENRLLNQIRKIGMLPLLRIPEGVALSPPSIALLSWVSRTPGCGVLEIAKGLQLSAPTISVGIRRLVKDGWLERRDDPNDRRARPLFLTPKSETLMVEIRKHRSEMLSFFLSGLNIEEQNQLLNLMERAINQMEKRLSENNGLE